MEPRRSRSMIVRLFGIWAVLAFTTILFGDRFLSFLPPIDAYGQFGASGDHGPGDTGGGGHGQCTNCWKRGCYSLSNISLRCGWGGSKVNSSGWRTNFALCTTEVSINKAYDDGTDTDDDGVLVEYLNFSDHKSILVPAGDLSCPAACLGHYPGNYNPWAAWAPWDSIPNTTCTLAPN